MNALVPKSKSTLAITLSKLAAFDKEKLKLMKEQYSTDSEAAAEAIWFAYMNDDIKGKAVADLGCGTGLLGIAALLLGSEKVYFVDSDKDALAIAAKNISAAADNATVAKAVLVNDDVKNFAAKVDTVIQNPPFGTKQKHADRQFLLQAFKAADVIYSFHKIETAHFVRKIASDNGFAVTNILPMQLQLKPTYQFHRSRMRRVKVGLFRLARIKPQAPKPI